MFGIKDKSLDNENIKCPPDNEPYTIINALFTKNHEISVNSLSLTILELIKNNQIKCEINLNESYSLGSMSTQDDTDVMKNITLRIANKGELKTSESLAISLLKSMNKNKKFTLKDMVKQSNITSIANNFEKDFLEYVKGLKNENNYDSKDYNDILVNGKLADNFKKEWKNFKEYLLSDELTSKYPPESVDENSSQIIYAAVFDIEKEALKLRQNNSTLTDFIDKDGYKLLNIIFNNVLSNVSEKRKGDGIFYGVNDKYTILGGG